jgi:hypothetical protein
MSEIIPIDAVERLTLEIQAVSEQILFLEQKRAELLWRRNQLLSQNAERQTNNLEVRHYAGKRIS